MNKGELSRDVAAALGIAKASGAAAVDLVLDAITVALAAGEVVNLHGFGAFRLTHRAPQGLRKNHLNGRFYDTKASTNVRFKAHQALRARLPAPPADVAAE